MTIVANELPCFKYGLVGENGCSIARFIVRLCELFRQVQVGNLPRKLPRVHCAEVAKHDDSKSLLWEPKEMRAKASIAPAMPGDLESSVVAESEAQSIGELLAVIERSWYEHLLDERAIIAIESTQMSHHLQGLQ